MNVIAFVERHIYRNRNLKCENFPVGYQFFLFFVHREMNDWRILEIQLRMQVSFLRLALRLRNREL